MFRRLRGHWAACCLLVTCMAASACTAGDKSDKGGSSAAPFAVTIQQHYGTAHLAAKPKRVIALTQQAVDTVLAFGMKPIAYLQDGMSYPWQTQLGSGKENGELKAGKGTELNYEKIAALRPDLIVGSYAILDKGAFDTLSKIAPTIGPIKVDSNAADTWQTMTTTLGEAFGMKDKAQTLIDQTNAKISATSARYPALKGKSYSFVSFFQGQTYAVLRGDGASDLFQQLGLVLAPGLSGLKGNRAQLSYEKLGLLDGDMLIAMAGSPEEQAKITKDARYSRLPAVKSTAAVWLSMEDISGLNTPSVLSIPYCLDKLSPTFAKAAGQP